MQPCWAEETLIRSLLICSVQYIVYVNIDVNQRQKQSHVHVLSADVVKSSWCLIVSCPPVAVASPGRSSHETDAGSQFCLSPVPAALPGAQSALLVSAAGPQRRLLGWRQDDRCAFRAFLAGSRGFLLKLCCNHDVCDRFALFDFVALFQNLMSQPTVCCLLRDLKCNLINDSVWMICFTRGGFSWFNRAGKLMT